MGIIKFVILDDSDELEELQNDSSIEILTYETKISGMDKFKSGDEEYVYKIHVFYKIKGEEN
jgi:hypothetical protein